MEVDFWIITVHTSNICWVFSEGRGGDDFSDQFNFGELFIL